MKQEFVMVTDEYGNEIFIGETCGECQRYCITHNITGSNGEYIAFGTLNEISGEFEAYDYTEIDNTAWIDSI